MKGGIYLNDLGIICALGSGQESVCANMWQGSRAGLAERSSRQGTFTLGVPPRQSLEIPPRFENRLNKLLAAACNQIRQRVGQAVAVYGEKRMAVVIGSTDNGSEQSLSALATYQSTGAFPREYEFPKQEAQHGADFVRFYLGLAGLACNVSTACTSGAKALIMARDLIETGAADGVVAGGADIVSEAVLLGFHALEVLDRQPCLPFSKNRRGINLGEGAALFLLTGSPELSPALRLVGCGESSDGYHITAPEPEGIQASAAMTEALLDAKISSGEIDYINLHGTGTELNDRMEAKATTRVFPNSPPASSTKSLVGHTLGAAGAIEFGFCWLTLSDRNINHRLPPHVWDGEYETDLPRLNLVPPDGTSERLRYCMSNSFAFGGCNVSLIIKREEADG